MYFSIIATPVTSGITFLFRRRCHCRILLHNDYRIIRMIYDRINRLVNLVQFQIICGLVLYSQL